MSPDVVRHATNSFFTVKEPGSDAGLGLWMVQHFVSASDGRLDIETNPGQGTTVRLIFPGASENE